VPNIAEFFCQKTFGNIDPPCILVSNQSPSKRVVIPRKKYLIASATQNLPTQDDESSVSNTV
jgi:hypothetical protein